MSWREAVYLTHMLLRNPQSLLQAAVNGWKYPVSFEWMLQAQHLDAFVRANSKGKPTPVARPWPAEGSTRVGRPTHSQAEIRDRLRRMNMKEL